jgi:hypothetical protein
MAGYFLTAERTLLFYGADLSGNLYRGSTLLWRKAPGKRAFLLLRAKWSSFGVSVAVDEAGVVTHGWQNIHERNVYPADEQLCGGCFVNGDSGLANHYHTCQYTISAFYVESVGGSFAD